MNILPKSIENLIEQFNKLPGIGRKTASRLVFYLLNQPKEETEVFGQLMLDLKTSLHYCRQCFNISDQPVCQICGSASRDHSLVMAVEEPLDVIALEKTEYDGLYHILGGVISPMDGIGPTDLKIKELLERLADEKSEIKELILATDPSLEGEATAMYLAKEIENWQNDGKIDKNLKITRIARGLPVGGDLEYADEVTLARSIEGRRKI